MKIIYFVEKRDKDTVVSVGGGCWAICCNLHPKTGSRGIL